MNTNSNKAASASSTISHMTRLLTRWVTLREVQHLILIGIVGTLAACASAPPPNPQSDQGQPPVVATPPAPPPASSAPSAASPVPTNVPDLPIITQPKSRWVPVAWSELPGLSSDALHEAWNAWIRSCARPAPALAGLCSDIRRLAIADANAQRAWMYQKLQPYRVEPLGGRTEGLLTAYYEPVFSATRQPSATHRVPLWQAPASLATRKPWYTRQQIDTLPEAQAQLRGREIAYLADPIDALILQIQGSGRLLITEQGGTQRLVRVAFAGTNEQPYRSVGRWLLDQNLIRDATWPGIKAWIAANPSRVQEMLWSNPRMVFFREELMDANIADAPAGSQFEGPRGAQGVPLTAGRSIAVDRESIPLGAPVWLESPGPTAKLQRLVIAQDVGSAILGAVRADYYVGSGFEAGELAGRLKQSLNLWVLWPR
jgi:membrane-bound lytic murein transglycosylase A